MKNVAMVALLLLGACYEPDRNNPEFKYGACDADWDFECLACMCQAPCESKMAAKAATGTDECEHAVSFDRNGRQVETTCFGTFEWEGVEGCCANINYDVAFFACD